MLDRQEWGNTGKDRTGILGWILVTENTSVLAFPQVLHSSWATDAQLLRGFGRVTASTATSSGMEQEPHYSEGLTDSIQSFWLNETHGMEENETFRTQVGQVSIGRFWQLGHTGFKEGSLLNLSSWSQFFTISKSVFTRSLWTMDFKEAFMLLQVLN